MQYPVLQMTQPPPSPSTPKPAPRSRKPWRLLLVLPYLGLLFPQFYARATPAFFGFPFFYWYQLLWVILASALIAIVYRKLDL